MARNDRRMERQPLRQDMSSGPGPLTSEELRDVEVKHYAVIQAAAAIAVRELEGNIARRQAEFRNIISLLLPLAFLVGGWFINDSLTRTLDERVDERLNQRSEELLGYVELRSLVEELETRMADFDITSRSGVSSDDLSSFLNRFEPVMGRIRPILNRDEEALERLSLSLADVENLRWRILSAYDEIGRAFRATSRYDGMVDVYRLGGSGLLTAEGDFLSNFAFGAGMILLDEVNLPLARETQEPVSNLHKDHQTALKALRGSEFDHYHALLSLLIDAKLGATDAELISHKTRIEYMIRVAEERQADDVRGISPLYGMLGLVREAGYDAFSVEGVKYTVAGQHIYSTLRRGCEDGAFLPSNFCDPLLSGSYLEVYEYHLRIEDDAAARREAAISVSLPMQKERDPVTGHIILTEPVGQQ